MLERQPTRERKREEGKIKREREKGIMVSVREIETAIVCVGEGDEIKLEREMEYMTYS